MAREGEGAGPAGHAPRGAASDACTCASLPTGVTATLNGRAPDAALPGSGCRRGACKPLSRAVRAEITPAAFPPFRQRRIIQCFNLWTQLVVISESAQTQTG